MIARDKQLHFLAGAAIAALFIFCAGPVWSLIAAAAAGAAKEVVWDGWMGRGTVELADFVWTVAGAVPFILLMGVWNAL